MNEIHEMTLDETYPFGELWLCPECGRVLLINWSPFKKTVISPGEEFIQHCGGKEGLTMNVHIKRSEEE